MVTSSHPSPASIAIVGAGLMGRLLAVQLSDAGYYITLFDKDSPEGTQSCAHTGAGMLAPYVELESAEPLIFDLGRESLALWESILKKLPRPVYFKRTGSLVVAHQRDMPDLLRLEQSLTRAIPAEFTAGMEVLENQAIKALEPELAGFNKALYFADEGQIDNRQLLNSLGKAIQERPIDWRSDSFCNVVEPYQVIVNGESRQFDTVIDCRGLGAKSEAKTLRGVRGEIVHLHANDVHLSRPVRLMHPRYPLYIVPRENNRYLIGATSIESDDTRPMTVQSAMELLSAAFTVHRGFAEATILELDVNCRPALPDNLPRIDIQPGLIQVNGLYRHGFLISPALSAIVVDYFQTGEVALRYSDIVSLSNPMEMQAHALCSP